VGPRYGSKIDLTRFEKLTRKKEAPKPGDAADRKKRKETNSLLSR